MYTSKSALHPLGYTLEGPKGLFRPVIGASVTYDFLWDDWAGDIQFPMGSSPQAQAAALEKYDLAPPLYKLAKWKEHLPVLGWGQTVETFMFR